MTTQFGVVLRRLRRQAGMTQEQLAERSGVGVRTIRGFETGERADPRVATVRLLADAVKLAPAERDQLLLAAAAGRSPQADPPDGSADQTGTEAAVPLVTPSSRTDPGLPDALADTADQLAQAVTSRWRREAEQRQIADPFPLPVGWRPVPEHLTDHWANIRRAPAGAESGPLDLTGDLEQVVDVYRRIPSGRLVVLGRAGSGKTVLTLRFVLGLLADRARDGAVPVIFGLGSWNPATTSLREWLTGRLVRDFPGLAAPGPGGSTLAAALVEADGILPVLDGFDEIADGLHRAALEALNTTTLPLLLTSRPAEYAAAVEGTDVLTSAAGIELSDLTLTDVVNYLPRTARKAAPDPAGATGTPGTSGTVWDPVLTELRADPPGPAGVNLAAVLATPLMVMLARTSYSNTPGQDPSELLDTERFATPEAIEDHLLDSFIPTVYRYQPDNRPTGQRRRWELDRVQDWLGYLATHLDRLGTRDLAWWQLSGTLRRSSRILAVGIVAALVIGIVDSLVDGIPDGMAGGLLAGLVNGFTVGPAFALVHGITVVFGRGAIEPSRVRIRLLRGTGDVRTRFVPRFTAGLLGGLLFGLGDGLVSGLMNAFFFDFGDGLVSGLINGLVAGPVFGLAAGLVFGFVSWFESPLDIGSAASPSDLLSTNRTTVVFQLLMWVPLFGLAVGFGMFSLIELARGFLGPLVFGLEDAIAVGLASGLGGGLGYALSFTAWGQWVIFARLWLPLTGRLPWDVMAFLDDAYQRGVLRQSGAVYQFRHARLQDRLSTVRRRRCYRARRRPL
ncbi:helix-turn-helix domain-containing protein [Amycolatopsis sp. NBC_00345]|uniref:XRE family transcriptional regulator n=1 Tax=Amycolatopsis sp. NBC_00345 TaxID=2975955 RepID=UPI002E265AB3